MIIRSSSTPILNSWVPLHSAELSPECDFFHHIQKAQPTSLTSSFKTMSKSRSEDDLQDMAVQKRSPPHHSLIIPIDEDDEEEDEEELDLKLNSTRLSMNRLFSSTDLLEELVEDEDSAGDGSNCGGRFNGGGAGDGFSQNENNNSTDAYYQKMITSDPGNSLLLGNYAKFLKEVCGDVARAEEFYERAVLANPNDGKLVSFYADLIWEAHKDAPRAEKYFDQAIQAEPNDCYVMAAYARFLWDTEEEEQEIQEEVQEEDKEETAESKNSETLTGQHDLCHGHGVSLPAISAY